MVPLSFVVADNDSRSSMDMSVIQIMKELAGLNVQSVLGAS